MSLFLADRFLVINRGKPIKVKSVSESSNPTINTKKHENLIKSIRNLRRMGLQLKVNLIRSIVESLLAN